MRARGLLEGAVLSTWCGELDNIPNMRSLLNDLDICVVEQNMPTIEQTGSMNNYSLRLQKEQLRVGILYVPDDVWVLKCRTDKTFAELEIFEPFLVDDSIDFRIKPIGVFPVSFNYKVCVCHFMYFMSICPHDMIFYGHKSDIQKFGLLMSANSINPGMVCDHRVFIDTFVLRHDFLFSSGLCFSPGYNTFALPIGRYIKETSEDNFILPKFLNRFLAIIFTIVCTQFLTPNSENISDIKDFFTFREALEFSIRNCNPSDYSYTSFTIGYIDAKILVTGKAKKTKGYEAFLAEVENVKNNAHCGSITDYEYNELVQFGERELGLSPTQWLKPPVKIHIPRIMKSIDFANAANILFDCDLDIDFIEYINRTGRTLYSDLIHNIDYFKDSPQYFNMLISGCCIFLRKLTYMLTLEYYNDTIPQKIRKHAWSMISKATDWGTFSIVDLKVENYKLIFCNTFFQLPETPVIKKETLFRNIMEELDFSDDAINDICKKEEVNYYDELLINCKHFIQTQDIDCKFDYRSISIIELLSRTINNNYFPSSSILNTLINTSDYASLLKIMELQDISYASELVFDIKCAEYLFKFGRNEEGEFYLRLTQNKDCVDDLLWLVFKFINTSALQYNDTLIPKSEYCNNPFIYFLNDVFSNLQSGEYNLSGFSTYLLNITEEQYYVLIKILFDFRVIRIFKDILLNAVILNKNILISLFLEFEQDSDVDFIITKNNCELWIGSKLINNHNRIKHIIPNRNWQNTDINPNCLFSCCIAISGNNILLTLELDIFTSKYDFLRWKLLRDIEICDVFLIKDGSIYVNEYTISQTKDYNELCEIAKDIVVNYNNAKNKFLSILGQAIK